MGIPVVDLDSLSGWGEASAICTTTWFAPTSDYDLIAEDLAAVDNPNLVVGVIEAAGFPGSAGA